MSEFSDRCKQLLLESGSNVYQIAKRSSLDRTSIQRMITGKRLPSKQFVKDFCSYLRISPIEKSELLELYDMEKIGKTTYLNRWYVKNLIETLAIAENNHHIPENTSVLYKNSIPNVTHLSDTTVLDHAENTILTVLEFELQNNPKQEILLNVPSSYTFLFQTIQRIFKDAPEGTSIKHLVTLNKNPLNSAHSSRNLEALSHILPIAKTLTGHYHPFYIYSSLTPSDEKLLIMPYYIITSQHLLILSSDFKSVSVHTSGPFVENYRSEMMRILDMAEPLIKYTSLPMEIITRLEQTYMNLGKPSHSFEFHPCFFFMSSTFQVPEELIERTKDAQVLLSAFQGMYRAMDASETPTMNFFSEEGLRQFCSTGKCLGQYNNITEGFPATERKLMLNQYCHRNQEDEFHGHMLKPDFKVPAYVSIELHNNHRLHLFSLKEDFEFAFIEIDESSICEAFFDFFESLPDSELAYSKEETCNKISNYISMI